MKAFEKWWNKLCGIGDAEALEKYKSRYQTGYCNGYREALEWVLDMKKEDVYGGDAFNKSYHIPDWAVDIIEKELEE